MATAMYEYYGHAPRYELGHHAPRFDLGHTPLHLRSQSMPEAVYHQHLIMQQQQQQMKARPAHQAPPSRPHPQGLRRSHTNVAELSRLLQRPNNYGLYHARSRSNITALGLNEAVYNRPRPTSTSINRASSFYHHRDHRSMAFLTSSRSSLALPSAPPPKNLDQPLHVDCSVEYDLGHQPKIPKDSAPLLIIHPAFVASEVAPLPASKKKRVGVARHSSFVVTSPPKLEAKRPDFGSLFHLSMPDIAASEVVEARPRPLPASEPFKTHNKRAQHRHNHDVIPKARVSLATKLEAVRKLSSESGSSNLEKSVIQHQRPLCDSGLGTPMSLMDEASMASMSSSNNSSGSSLKSKWRSSMTGLVSGFFCCSAGLASIEAIRPSRPPTSKFQPQNKYVVQPQQQQNVFICAPEAHQQMTSITTSTASGYWNDEAIMTSSPAFVRQKNWITSSSASNSADSSVTSGSNSHQPRRLVTSFSVCRFCQSTNPGEDCKDGFCSKVWSKENGLGSFLMRPIHI